MILSTPVLRVMLIEDNDEHAMIISRHLSRAGEISISLHREVTLAGGLARLASAKIDVLLLDLRLPDSDIAETLPRTLKTAPQVPIIVLSSLEDRELGVRAIHEGAQDYLCKSRLSEELLVRAILNSIERKSIELALTKAKEEAEQANAAKNRFLAALSHELRTPLTPVMMICSSLEENQDLTPDVRLALRTARRNVEFEVTLIDDLLDFTQASRGKLNLKEKTVDMHLLLRDSMDLFVISEARKKHIHFECHMDARRHHIYADSGRIQQVFCNLFKNALKFTPRGGSISVRTLNASPDKVAIEVSDTGIGIDKDVLPKLFHPFEQGNAGANFGGLGLGLMVSQTIIDAHCGTISASSPGRDQGATFRVELGAIPEKVDNGEKDGHSPRPESRKLRLLLVEDHTMTREILARLLAKHGYIVHEAPDVAAAKKAAEGGPFDLVLSDLGLPDGDGRELMKHLKNRYGLKGIAFSGYGTEDDVNTSQNAGFNEHLTKPVEWARLFAAINRVMMAA